MHRAEFIIGIFAAQQLEHTFSVYTAFAELGFETATRDHLELTLPVIAAISWSDAFIAQ